MFEFQQVICGYKVVHDECVIHHMLNQSFTSMEADNKTEFECWSHPKSQNFLAVREDRTSAGFKSGMPKLTCHRRHKLRSRALHHYPHREDRRSSPYPHFPLGKKNRQILHLPPPRVQLLQTSRLYQISAFL